MSSFFTIPSAQRKRKRPATSEPSKKRIASSTTSKPQRKPQRDESISGSEDESDDGAREPFEDDAASTSSSSDVEGEEGETAAERRLKLAERYLENIREEVDEVGGFDAEQIDRDLIAERLQEDAAESKGRLYRNLALDLDFEQSSNCTWKWNGETVTSVATCYPFAYTVTKDIGLSKWKIQDLPSNQWLPLPGKKSKKPKPPPKKRPEQLAFVRGDKKKAKDNNYKGHTDSILTVAASSDGKFVVTGGADRRIIVWDTTDLKPLRVFSHHRDAVTGLAFRRGTNQMYSSSKDRTIKVWSLDELAYIETLFGHQDSVVDIASLSQERCLSVGARDRTARLWKVMEETQLVFRGGGSPRSKSSRSSKTQVHEGSMDRVAMIDEEMFVTGGDNGSLSLWVTHKKKPLFTIDKCHGVEEPIASDEASAEVDPAKRIVPVPQPRWITALTTIPYSDLILSGSWDGCVRVWKVSEDRKKIEVVGDIGGERGVRGVVNDISVFERGDRGKDGVCVIAAVGKEHRFGRWIKYVSGQNGGVIFEIPKRARSEVVHGKGVDVDIGASA